MKIDYKKITKVAILTLAIGFFVFLLFSRDFILTNKRSQNNSKISIPVLGNKDLVAKGDNLLLSKAVSDYYITNRLIGLNPVKCSSPTNEDWYPTSFDLDNDGKNEYIVSINFACGYPLRSASGGEGDYVIFRKNNDKYMSEGAVFGNGFGVSPESMNGRKVIYTTGKIDAAYQSITEWQWNPESLKYEAIKPNYVTAIRMEKNDNNYYPIYSFYNSQFSLKTKTLAEIHSTIPIEEHFDNDGRSTGLEDAVNNGRYFLKDITGDGRPEFFVKVEQNASNLQIYEILHWEGGTLANIKIAGQKDNPTWVDFDAIAFKDPYISMTWHGSTSDYKIGRNDYQLIGSELHLMRSFIFDYSSKNENGYCNVFRKSTNSPDFIKIAQEKECGYKIDDFDKYIIK